MSKIAASLTGRYARRLVLIDSPPLLVSSEAQALVQIPGQVVLVVRSGRTPRQALLDAVNLVDKAKLHGLILNDASVTKGEGYYYGYPAYGSRGNENTGGG
jgi:Mrp family chromosome partitioning ATPase